MVEIGECSGTKPSEETWATLVPLNEKYSVIKLTSDEVAIYSEILPSSSEKHVWCKITRNPDLCSATLHCLSSTAILVDGVAVHNKGDVSIRSGSEIFAAPDTAGNLSYRFEVMPAKDYCKQQLKICLDADHVKCSICLNVWHDAVTVAPCLHNFCNGCFSEWLRRSQEKHTNVLCPQCRAVVQFVGRNHFLHTIVEDILKTDESLQRSDEEFAVLDSYATIKSNLVITAEKTRRQKRAHPSSNAEYDSMDLPCPQCGRELGGFRCSQTTVHLPCQACGGLMPSRPNISVPQHCVGCDRAFCGAYWHAQRITQSNTHTHSLCNRETLKPIVERTVSRIPSVAHESNQHEHEITERCITQMGRTVQSVISEWIVKLNNREIDRAKLPLKNAEMITSATHVCNDCYDNLVSFLLYWFRISIPRYHLPPDVAKREDCWYGYGCRTQHHNEDHARKRNHVCRPTRWS